jgi:hypothetical protein
LDNFSFSFDEYKTTGFYSDRVGTLNVVVDQSEVVHFSKTNVLYRESLSLKKNSQEFVLENDGVNLRVSSSNKGSVVIDNLQLTNNQVGLLDSYRSNSEHDNRPALLSSNPIVSSQVNVLSDDKLFTSELLSETDQSSLLENIQKLNVYKSIAKDSVLFGSSPRYSLQSGEVEELFPNLVSRVEHRVNNIMKFSTNIQYNNSSITLQFDETVNVEVGKTIVLITNLGQYKENVLSISDNQVVLTLNNVRHPELLQNVLLYGTVEQVSSIDVSQMCVVLLNALKQINKNTSINNS